MGGISTLCGLRLIRFSIKLSFFKSFLHRICKERFGLYLPKQESRKYCVTDVSKYNHTEFQIYVSKHCQIKSGKDYQKLDYRNFYGKVRARFQCYPFPSS